LSIAQLERKLHSQIVGGDCNKDLYIQFLLGPYDVGIGAELNMVVSNILYLLVYRNGYLVFEEPDTWRYAKVRNCTKGWMCFFKPLSNCQNHRVRSFSEWPPNRLRQLENGRYPIPFDFSLPGSLDVYVAITKFIWRPQDWLAEKFERFQKLIDWSGGVIAMHVRHGDKKDDYGLLPAEILLELKMKQLDGALGKITLDAYMLAAERMRALYGVSKILIATDDKSVLDGLSKFENWTIINVEDHVQEDPRLYRVKGVDGSSVLRIIDTMSRANYFVGTFSSCMGRFIYQLGRSRGNFLNRTTFHSVDVEWYPDP
jgi:hypothetical protein